MIESPLSSPQRNIVDIEVQVRNVGDDAGDGGTLAVWGNMPLAISNDMHGEVSASVGVLQPGQTKAFSFSRFFGKFMQPGTNAVRAFVDVSNRTEEIHEYNNQTYVRHVAEEWGSSSYKSGVQLSLLESGLLAYYDSLPETNAAERVARMTPICEPFVLSGEIEECLDYEACLAYDFRRSYYRLKQWITNGTTNINVMIAVANRSGAAASNLNVTVWFDNTNDVVCGERGDATSVTLTMPPRGGRYFSFSKVYTGEVKVAMFRCFIDSNCAYDETSEADNIYGYTYQITNRVAPFSFTAFALTNSAVLRWTEPRDSGMNSSLVRIHYDSSDYPATTNDGTLLYLGTNLVYEHTNMPAGQPCYYTIWVTHNNYWFIEPPD